MNYKEFYKALESLTDEERQRLLKAFMDNSDKLMKNIDSAILIAKEIDDLPNDFGMTNERESDVELPDDFGMTREH